MRDDIRAGMQVLGSDGGLIGEVDGVSGDTIKLKRAIGDGPHHFVPAEWVARVDDHVHLSLDAATARDRWTVEGGHDRAGYAAAPAATEGRKTNWIPWVIGLILLAAVLVIGVRSCGYAAADQNYEGNASDVNLAAADVEAMGAAAARGDTAPLGEAEAYLAGTAAGPRTFAFERLNFDTSSAQVRDADRAEVTQLATVLQRYPMTAIQVIGYADARGSGAANATLGQQRADAVKAALVSAGVAAERITTQSGGEQNPAGSNATSGGQFENRRTEVVISR